MNYTDLPLSELTWVIVDVIANQHDSLILQSHRWTVLTLGGNLMNKAFKLIPTFLKCASSRSSFGRSLLLNEKKNEPRRHAVHSSTVILQQAGPKIQFTSRKDTGIIFLLTAWPATLFFSIFGSTHHLPCHQILLDNIIMGDTNSPLAP